VYLSNVGHVVTRIALHIKLHKAPRIGAFSTPLVLFTATCSPGIGARRTLQPLFRLLFVNQPSPRASCVCPPAFPLSGFIQARTSTAFIRQKKNVTGSASKPPRRLLSLPQSPKENPRLAASASPLDPTLPLPRQPRARMPRPATSPSPPPRVPSAPAPDPARLPPLCLHSARRWCPRLPRRRPLL
jgi:hypothetical protein